MQWDVIGLGDDFHVFHVHGHRWLRNGTPVDSELVGPSSTLQVRFRETRRGSGTTTATSRPTRTTG